ncbi:helix-turn-helix domain-containing protein [Deinococcus cellulosilyticus]|uniref:OmpR/PhoB-type domain-containing protein n=1 Tax=Deinococcus cellulosilyticus (strain DSM 18568 / NBRC 106333 / KACC 11606 / 5516J-15) TaxID=1223518 RepID=A0A511NC75_DEIC1|nr:helix-turn-helix domain-containing protein [Deinococcus cellulosilyticus]GEM49961.1 hypothetical protein DC3_55960 [Deinococcus cellulosilyticus NBRC 106333 = KACC 11606]
MSLSDSRWFKRLQGRMLHQRKVLHFRAPLEYGAPYLIDALRSKLPPLVWFELTDRETGDLVAQTNKLVEAFNRTVGQNIIDYGVTPLYIATILQRYDAIFDRYCFVYSGVEVVPGLMELFQQLVELGHQVVILGEMDLSGADVVPREELLLTPAEMLDLSGLVFQLSQQVVDSLQQKSLGVFETFWVEAHLQKGWSIPQQPCAVGRRLPRGYEIEIKPAFLLPMLLKKEKYLEALELAVDSLPEQVPGFLERAASRLILQGEHEQLFKTLQRLPEGFLSQEVVLRWRLEAAYLMNQQERLRTEVLDHLEQHAAPDLRALAANLWFFGAEDRFNAEVQRAVEQKRSALTVLAQAKAYRWQVQGLGDIQKYVDLLFEALRLAEQSNDLLMVIRVAVQLPYGLLLNNQLQEAMHWANWSMQFLNSLPFMNAVDRLFTVNVWYYTRILSGQFEGLEAALQEALRLSRATSEIMTFHLNCTWTEYCLIAGHPERALEYWLELWRNHNRHDKGRFAYYLVRLLVALGRDREAEKYAREALALNADAPAWKKRYAHLALALSLVRLNPEEALQHIHLVESPNPFKYTERVWVAAPLIKKILLERMGLPEDLEADPLETAYLRQLTLHERLEYVGSLNLLKDAGMEEAKPQDQLLIRTLGRTEIRLRGEVLDLSPKQVEIIVLLALHPQGLSGEQLLLELYGDEGSYGNLKALISRLRRTVPIQSQPYKLQLNYRADFQELFESIRQGRVDQVLELYGGRLLEQSRAPGIESLRQELERQLKSLIENTRDSEWVLRVAEKFEDDLEVWEHLAGIISRQSQHYAFVLAKVKRLREDWGVV